MLLDLPDEIIEIIYRLLPRTDRDNFEITNKKFLYLGKEYKQNIKNRCQVGTIVENQLFFAYDGHKTHIINIGNEVIKVLEGPYKQIMEDEGKFLVLTYNGIMKEIDSKTSVLKTNIKKFRDRDVYLTLEGNLYEKDELIATKVIDVGTLIHKDARFIEWITPQYYMCKCHLEVNTTILSFTPKCITKWGEILNEYNEAYKILLYRVVKTSKTYKYYSDHSSLSNFEGLYRIDNTRCRAGGNPYQPFMYILEGDNTIYYKYVDPRVIEEIVDIEFGKKYNPSFEIKVTNFYGKIKRFFGR